MGIEGVLAVGPEVCCACARMSEGFSFPVLAGVTHPLLSLYQGRVTEGSWGCGLEHLHPPATFLSWNLKLLSLSWQGYWSWWLRCSCLMEFRAWWLWATKPGCSRKQLSHQLGVHPSWVGLLSWKGKCVSLNLQEGGFLKYRTSGACWSQTLNCYSSDRICTWLPPIRCEEETSSWRGSCPPAQPAKAGKLLQLNHRELLEHFQGEYLMRMCIRLWNSISS